MAAPAEDEEEHVTHAVTLSLKTLGAMVFGGMTLFGAAFAFLLNILMAAPKEATADMSQRVSELRSRQDALEERLKGDMLEQRRDTNETLRAINGNLSILNTQITTVQVKLGIGMTTPTPVTPPSTTTPTPQ